jgi:hypothetical protein
LIDILARISNSFGRDEGASQLLFALVAKVFQSQHNTQHNVNEQMLLLGVSLILL